MSKITHHQQALDLRNICKILFFEKKKTKILVEKILPPVSLIYIIPQASQSQYVYLIALWESILKFKPDKTHDFSRTEGKQYMKSIDTYKKKYKPHETVEPRTEGKKPA